LLGQCSGLFICTVLLHYFHIISLVDCLALWNEFIIPLTAKKVMSTVFICDFDMQTLFKPSMPLRNTSFFHSFSPISLGEHSIEVSLEFVPNFTQNLMLIHRSTNQSHILAIRHKNTFILMHRHVFTTIKLHGYL